MKLDHICLAVRNIDSAAKSLISRLGYSAKTEKVTNTRQQVIVQFFELPGSLDIKLIQPSGPQSPLIQSLKGGEGLHHLGFKVEDVVTSCAELASTGARITAQPAPGEAFDDEPIAFAFVGAGLNIELIDTDKRRGQLTANSEK